jgi:hypothetical protein
MSPVTDPAPGWFPDPSGRWQVRWWDGSTWTDRVATAGRQASDPLPDPQQAADLVNRVVATALGYADLAETLREPVDEASVTAALWRDAETRRDVLLHAHAHLAALEAKGSDPPRAQALASITRALDTPPLMPL